MVNLYLDENVNVLLAPLLRARNIDVTTTLEHNMLGASDTAQLAFAEQQHRALVTHNRVDFENLYHQYIASNRTTPGIIILIRRDVYRMARLLSNFALTHENIENQLWYV